MLDVLAKHNDQTTLLGAILNPLADKTLLVGVYITLGLQGYLPNWLVVLVAESTYRRWCHHPVSGAARSEDAARS